MTDAPASSDGPASASGHASAPGTDGPVPAGGPTDPGSTARSVARRRRRRRGRLRLAVLVLLVVVVVVGVVGNHWVDAQADPGGHPSGQVIVTVATGDGADTVASLLHARGVIGSPLAYRIWTALHSAPVITPGRYAFPRGLSFAAADAVLAAGPNVYPLVVPAGFTVAELAQRVGDLPGHQAADFLHVATDGSVRSPWQPAGGTSLEGLLATGTYEVVTGESDAELLRRMVAAFDARADSLGLATGAAALGMSPYQVVTVASIDQKEGVLAENLGPVARVIDNRLADGMPLQMDSTVLYALGRDGGAVTPADLRSETPYNTYLHTGLTPTPVCFPSVAALHAALHPPAGAWRYFVVVDRDGREAFADTYAEQLANERLASQRGLG